MRSVFNIKIHTQLYYSSYKFISSLAAIENPSIYRVENDDKNPTFFNTSNFFIDYKRLRQYTIKSTKLLHTHLLKTSKLQSNIFVANSLLDGYCRCGSMEEAIKLFDQMSEPNIISWNTMISGYNYNYLLEGSWVWFLKMRFSGFEPDEITYRSVLSACVAMRSTSFGKQLYSVTMKNGFFSNGYVRTGMIDLFAKCCVFEDALRVFYDVSCCENVVCWNAIISGAVRSEENWVALDLFVQMRKQFLMPNSFTFSSVLSACAALKELEIGKEVQGWIIKCGVVDVFVGTALTDLYVKCGDMEEAVNMFSWMPTRDVVSWTAIISGFVQKDDLLNALEFFKEMRYMKVEINNYTATSLISACAKPDMIEEAKQIHSWIIKSGFYMDSVIQAALVNMYSKIGIIGLAEIVFKEMESIRSPNTWAVLISSFARKQSFQRVIELLRTMLKKGLRPDRFCTSSVFSVIECINLGRQMHCYTLKTGLIFYLSVESSLFTMYSKCGSLEDSLKVFQNIPVRDNVSCASMIAGFTEHGYAEQAVQLFREMLSEETKPDQMTLAATLSACSSLHCLHKGKEIHGYAIRAGFGNETLICGAVITLYSKCSALGLARRVFDMLVQKDLVSYSSLITGYAQTGLIEEAMLLFCAMMKSNLAVNSYTLSSILGASALSNKSGVGTQLHALVIKLGLDSEVSVGSSLVTMYSKCGSIRDSEKAFDEIDKPDLIGWTAMISSYAEHGKGVEALRAYELMRKEEINPDRVTFVGILSACSHNGLIEEGYYYLNSMAKEYGIQPGYHHYACMVDILGRLGKLREAEKFINNMPIEPNAFIWGTLLSACKVHGDVELGRLAAKKIIELEPCHSGPYVSLSNICADIGQWEGVLEIRSLMNGTGVRKEPGWSSV
ncbi:PREDICTED: pentatricopeptide repeat-containing protein At1g74600, chloroplastic [Theobroma cacao]|uniref:Pentatricopeptide repeat-containing protein At1g74600, chloroplastic n=1 Tax=Theobroma cacao TaxID=3641 RepID=A0AB32VXA0_THECC|nr:PREDICTED: pentatricopeptide repeat-containing protein At1g74600, chloroplastic [Theobroma cacao]